MGGSDWEVVSTDATPLPLVDKRVAPWTKAAYDMVVARGRVREEEVIAATMPTVPPGRAFREQERNRKRAGADSPEQRVVARPVEELVLSGQRTKVRDGIWHLIKRKRIVRVIDDHGGRWLEPVYVPLKDQALSAEAKHRSRVEANRAGWIKRRAKKAERELLAHRN